MHVVITGASSGIGACLAREYHAAGAHVTVVARRAALLTKLQSELGDRCDVVVADLSVADPTGWIGQLKPIDVFINNAGFNYNAPFEYTVESRARAMMETNFFGLYRLSQRMIPALRRGAESSGRTSKLVNVSSIGGSIGLPWEPFYHASKFAVNGLSEALRIELYNQNIRVVIVQPGGIRTDFMPKTDESLKKVLAEMPEEGRARYGKALENMRGQMPQIEKFLSPPEAVAKAFTRILNKQNPGFRTWVGLDARLLYAMHRILPFWLMHAILRRGFGA